MTEFYTSPTGLNNWDSDFLRIGLLKPDQSRNVTILDGRKVCTYDVKAVFDDGDTLEDYKINICELGRYTLTEN
jgi:hypothetical protein